MTYESNPFSSYLIFNKLSTSPKWFFIFRNEKKKKTPIFAPHVSSATTISFSFPYSNEVNFNICPHINTKLKLGAHFTKIHLE